MIDTLAAAYAEIGDFDSAMRYAAQALAVKGITPVDSKRIQQHLGFSMLQFLMTVGDQLLCWLARFELRVHLLQIRRERFNLLLLLGKLQFKVLR